MFSVVVVELCDRTLEEEEVANNGQHSVTSPNCLSLWV